MSLLLSYHFLSGCTVLSFETCSLACMHACMAGKPFCLSEWLNVIWEAESWGLCELGFVCVCVRALCPVPWPPLQNCGVAWHKGETGVSELMKEVGPHTHRLLEQTVMWVRVYECVRLRVCLTACGHVWKWAEESEKRTPSVSTLIRASRKSFCQLTWDLELDFISRVIRHIKEGMRCIFYVFLKIYWRIRENKYFY